MSLLVELGETFAFTIHSLSNRQSHIKIISIKTPYMVFSQKLTEAISAKHDIIGKSISKGAE